MADLSDHKARIISHLSADHQLALGDYLVVYGGIPRKQFVANSVRSSAVDEKALTINYSLTSGQTKSQVIHWDSAIEDKLLSVGSLGDVKEKLVAMAKYAAAKQGYSHKQVKKVALPDRPTGYLAYLLFPVLAIGSWDSTFLRSVFTSDPLLRQVLPYVPEFLGKAYGWMEPRFATIFTILYGVHLAETLIFTVPRAIKYRVPLRESLLWSLMHLIEGFPVIFRFRKVSEE